MGENLTRNDLFSMQVHIFMQIQSKYKYQNL